MNVEYRGRTRNGRGVSGHMATDDVVGFVEERFRAGWRTLSVSSGGREVGGIGRHLDTGRRTWWAEGRTECGGVV